MGYPGLLWDVPGVFPDCSGLFQGCSGDAPGCSGGVPGCSGTVPGFTDTHCNLMVFPFFDERNGFFESSHVTSEIFYMAHSEEVLINYFRDVIHYQGSLPLQENG